MPFFIQPTPINELPRTKIELLVNEVNSQRNQNSLRLDTELIDKASLMYRFNNLYKAWQKSTKYSSSLASITSDQNFLRIIDMGQDAIPFIINKIEKEPSTIVWAMNIITGYSIKSNNRLTVSEACKAWVKLVRIGKLSF